MGLSIVYDFVTKLRHSMTVHTVTFDLPQQVYEQIQKAAEKTQRPLKELLIEAVTAVAPVIGTASTDLRAALAQMAYWNDAALWRAARSTLSAEQKARLESLHDHQQRQGLTKEEEAEERALLQLYRETLLVRAQAAVLLKQRNYNVADPSQFHPFN
jgi:DNA primase